MAEEMQEGSTVTGRRRPEETQHTHLQHYSNTTRCKGLRTAAHQAE